MSATVYRPESCLLKASSPRSDLCVTGEGKVADPPPTGARVIDLPGTLMMPGLVNAHSHSWQRVIRSRTEFLEHGSQR